MSGVEAQHVRKRSRVRTVAERNSVSESTVWRLIRARQVDRSPGRSSHYPHRRRRGRSRVWRRASSSLRVRPQGGRMTTSYELDRLAQARVLEAVCDARPIRYGLTGLADARSAADANTISNHL